MTEVSPETPEENVAEEREPEERPDPEEYHASAPAESDSTGTLYDSLGEPEVTPHDLELEDAEEE